MFDRGKHIIFIKFYVNVYRKRIYVTIYRCYLSYQIIQRYLSDYMLRLNINYFDN